MAEPRKKSTGAVREIVHQQCGETVWLDSRLALFAEKGRWLALSDLHIGYEMSRRARGGLWPVWGADHLWERLGGLLRDYQPETLILNGDVIDSAAAGSLTGEEWLTKLSRRGEFNHLILIRGNHDRGPILRLFPWVDRYENGPFLFHHGHQSVRDQPEKDRIEVIGHLHPARRFTDGAGLALKLPILVQGRSRWVMPAFSPWAGGTQFDPSDVDEKVMTWACGPQRVFAIS